MHSDAFTADSCSQMVSAGTEDEDEFLAASVVQSSLGIPRLPANQQ